MIQAIRPQPGRSAEQQPKNYIPVISTIKTLLRTAPLIHPGRGPGALFKQGKHFLRGLVFLRQSQNWFEILQSPGLTEVSRNHPCLFQKLQRPYLNRTLNTTQRFRALEQHYHFVTTCFSPGAIKEMYAKPARSKPGSGGSVLLAALPLEEIGTFGLNLRFSRQEKEGDLAISLVNLDNGADLFTLTFSVVFFGPARARSSSADCRATNARMTRTPSWPLPGVCTVCGPRRYSSLPCKNWPASGESPASERSAMPITFIVIGKNNARWRPATTNGGWNPAADWPRMACLTCRWPSCHAKSLLLKRINDCCTVAATSKWPKSPHKSKPARSEPFEIWRRTQWMPKALSTGTPRPTGRFPALEPG